MRRRHRRPQLQNSSLPTKMHLFYELNWTRFKRCVSKSCNLTLILKCIKHANHTACARRADERTQSKCWIGGISQNFLLVNGLRRPDATPARPLLISGKAAHTTRPVDGARARSRIWLVQKKTAFRLFRTMKVLNPKRCAALVPNNRIPDINAVWKGLERLLGTSKKN